MKTDLKKPSAAPDTEPQSGFATVPIWLIALPVLLLYWGMNFWTDNHGGYDPQVYWAFNNLKSVKLANPDVALDLAAIGKEVYTAKGCFACHQTTGLGTPGQFPPLAGSDWVNTPGSARLIRLVLHGMSGELPLNGKMEAYPAAMPAWDGVLTDQEIAAVLSYIRQEWGNKAPPVTVPQVKAWREKDASRSAPWVPADLLKEPENE